VGGFLTTLSRAAAGAGGAPAGAGEAGADATPFESRAVPGLPLQVLCYERADDIGFGVSGVASRARAIRESFPGVDPSEIPLACPITKERTFYLLDPIGASRRSRALRAVDRMIRALGRILRVEAHALELRALPAFLHKKDGWIFSMGQFMQWVGSRLLADGAVQIWPGTPVAEPLLEGDRVRGVRLVDQGTDRAGRPDAGYMPGMDIRAELTVVGDGPVGAVGRALDERIGLPPGHHRRDWAVGMKMVVDLPEGCALEPGTAIHTLGYPEPEIFGFLYVHPGRVASFGIFVPSWFDSPVRTSYRYLQHWMRHPAIWPHLEGGSLRSWGAKTLQESGRRGEPFLAGDGFARIGEGSGSTNVLTGSGVDEAWATGVHLAEGVIDILRAREPFTRGNLERAYVARRRASWVEAEGRVAERARDGFQRGTLTGLVGMGLAGISRGALGLRARIRRPYERIPSLAAYYKGRIPPAEIESIREDCRRRGAGLHDALMERAGWPAIPYDGRLLVSHQDALLIGGKVQAPAGYADHVVFLYPQLCEGCGTKVCIEICSAEAITPGEGGVPEFDREKCIHCGACFWNCARPLDEDPERMNVDFKAGAGGLHSAEN
jgi:electron-transferring-flavoprotein dehydrogenase